MAPLNNDYSDVLSKDLKTIAKIYSLDPKGTKPEVMERIKSFERNKGFAESIDWDSHKKPDLKTFME